MLPSKIDQMKVSHETGSEANFGFGRVLMPSYLGMWRWEQEEHMANRDRAMCWDTKQTKKHWTGTRLSGLDPDTYKEEWKDNYAYIPPSAVNAKKPVCLICNEAIHRLFWMSFRTFQIKSSQFFSKSNIAAKTFSYFYFEGNKKKKWLWVIVMGSLDNFTESFW